MTSNLAIAKAIVSQSERRQSWVADPVAFARDALGVEFWELQSEVAKAILEHLRVVARSGHKIGKTKLAACIAIWWACTRKSGRVVITAPTFHQVKDLIWHEIVGILQGAKLGIPDAPKDPSTGIRWADGRYIIGVSTDRPENIAGFSGDELLFIIDEASGVDEAIFEALRGNMAGGARMLMLGNPTQASGTFFDAFNSKQEFWRTFHISSEETPNVVLGRDVVRGLATKQWVDEMRAEWGEESPVFQVRVKGNFADQAENAVIGMALVEAAVKRWATTPEDGPLEFGVDPAGFGDDDTIIYPRRGHKALEAIALHSMDPDQVAARVIAEVAKHRRLEDPKRIPVKVDSIGLGLGVCGCLRDEPSIALTRVNVAETSTVRGYSKLRDQLWFMLRDWLKDGGAIPPSDKKLLAELLAPTYDFDLQGRLKVEKKADVKLRLKRSPDRADALALAVFSRPPTKAPALTLTNFDSQSIWAG